MSRDIIIAVISALAALLGSAVGAVISYFTTYRLNFYQWRKERIDREIERREKLYSEFMSEVGVLLLKSADTKSFNAVDFSKMYALLAQIRLFSSKEVIEAADIVGKAALHGFVIDKKEKDNSHSSTSRFSEACRQELDEMRNKLELAIKP